MIDTKNTGYIDHESLRKSFQSLFPHISDKELRYLLNDKDKISFEELSNLLIKNEIGNFDPTIDAFLALDPMDQGFIDKDKLKNIFNHFSLHIDDNEMDILMKVQLYKCTLNLFIYN
jgi:Ca2+-binding EF-hand superfamily protein